MPHLLKVATIELVDIPNIDKNNKMKKFLLFLFGLFSFLRTGAQTYFEFTTSDGISMRCEILDEDKHEIAVGDFDIAPSSTLTIDDDWVIPATIIHEGKTYQVTTLGYTLYKSTGRLILPEGMTRIKSQIFYYATFSLVFPSTLKYLEDTALWGGELIQRTADKTFDMSHTQIEDFPHQCLGFMYQAYGDANNEIKFPVNPVKFPPTTKTIDADVFGMQDKFNDVGAPIMTNHPDIFLPVSIPPTITTSIYQPTALKDPFFKRNLIYIPIDATKRYEDHTDWGKYHGSYREQITIGKNGYTTHYLETENFTVPVGCTAYIITGINPSGSLGTSNQAVVKAFTTGMIIPKQTGFILQGPANSTVTYQANVTGTEEDVSNNLLIGTAIEQEFSSTGYKYYVFANGDKGLGFYKQGVRNGASIKLQPHRAGLRLAEAVAPAKGFTIDFDAARKEAETTGIRDVRPFVQPHEDIIYDLQGRRVKNPSRGIYIVNGKKVVRE